MINKQKNITIRSDVQNKTQAVKQMDITIRFNNIAIII